MEFQERLALFPTNNLPLEAPATIYWDEHLIPFIAAQTDADCAFLLGMVHTHLRQGQMELIRRVVQGRLAESAGPLATKVDHSLRIINLAVAVDSIEQILAVVTKNWLLNYVKGINHYLAQVPTRAPELKMLGITPEPWQLKDILTISRLMAVDVNWFNWFQWLKLQDKPYFNELWQRFVAVGAQSTPSFPNQSSALGAFIAAGIKSGSNALVVAGSKSADSCALIASDPHLGLQVPNTWIIAGYQCPSFHVLGLMFPGIPMVLVGRNPAIAWAGTNMRSASSDLYEVNTTAADSLPVRNDRVKVRWWRDKTLPIRTSNLGPIISDAPLLPAKSTQTLAMKWVGHQPSDEFTAFLKVNQATNWNHFREAFGSYGVSGQNFVYADTVGHIGLVLAVQLPKRHPELVPQLCLNPDSAHHHWQGVIKPSELPSIYDPPAGFLASANNRTVILEPPLGYFFSANDRIDRLSELLSQSEPIDLQALQRIQLDVFVPSAIKLRNQVIERIVKSDLIDSSNQKMVDLFQQLQQWDGYYHVESRGAVAFEIFRYHFIQDFYTHIYDDEAANLLRGSEHANLLLSQDLQQRDSTLINSGLQVALKKASKEHQKFANWGDMHRLQLTHPLGNIPLFGRRFRFGDYPAAGSYNSAMKTAHQTVNQRHATFYGANARFISRLKDPNENYFVLLGGQDGWLGSPNLVDQVPLWLAAKYLKIPLELTAIRASFSYQIHLTNNAND